jgi:ElaB/YqjD/DUF883 family membrane-anchored ribosome-binding protein
MPQEEHVTPALHQPIPDRTKENCMETNYPSSGSQTGSSIGGGAGFGRQASDSSTLREELSSLKSDLDDLVSRAASLTDRELSDARDRLWSKFSSMRHSMRGMADQARTQLNQGMDVTSDYVKDKPLQSVAIAAGVGLLIGALMRGRD